MQRQDRSRGWSVAREAAAAETDNGDNARAGNVDTQQFCAF